MIPAINSPILLAVGVFLCAGMLWQAAGPRENRLWNVLGAAGWGLVAVTAFTNGITQIGIAVAALAVFAVGIVIRWLDPGELPKPR